MLTKKQKKILSIIYSCPFAIAKSDCFFIVYRNNLGTFRPQAFIKETPGEVIDFLLNKHADCYLLRSIKEINTKKNLEKKSVLSEREKEIASLICKGLSNNDIAARFKLSVFTVKNHRKKIYRKMKVNNTAALMNLFIKMGLYCK